jgi:peptidoglycan/LPS O-acetylase OafA/YrhL
MSTGVSRPDELAGRAGFDLLRRIRSIPDRYGRRAVGGTNAGLDGLRFIAIAIVVVGHLSARLYQIPELRAAFSDVSWQIFMLTLSQTVGVLLFFAISGFVTAMQIDGRRKKAGGDVEYISFMKRRFWRIAPPYYIVTIASFVIMSVFGVKHSSLTSTDTNVSDVGLLAASLVYSYGWLLDGFPKFFVGGWSLEIEMQCYLLAPLLMVLLSRAFASSRGRMMLWLLLAACMVLTASGIAGLPHIRFTIVRYGVYFLLGCVLYFVWHAIDLHGMVMRHRRAVDIAGIAALLCLVLFQAPYDYAWGTAISYAFTAASIVSMVVLFACCLEEKTILGRFCSNRYVSFLGSICYSLYLTHMYVIFAIGKIAGMLSASIGPVAAVALFYLSGVLAIVVCGFVFFRFVERPFTHWRIA